MSRGPYDEDKYTKRAEALVRELEWFEQIVEGYAKEGVVLKGFSVRFPEFEGGEYFLVVRAASDGERVVAFRDGEDLVSLLRGFLRAAKAKSLKFREDRYE